jgi:apolipoprotein N-acyltransferase
VWLIASFVSGLVMAWCGAPGPAGVLLLVPLAGVLALVASAPRASVGAWRAFAAGLGFFVPFLLWLPQSFGAGFGWFGAVMFLPLYALLASFWALTAWVCLRLVRRWRLGCGCWRRAGW